MAIGPVELVDGRTVRGFVCRAGQLPDAADISSYGGWRRYLAEGTTGRR